MALWPDEKAELAIQVQQTAASPRMISTESTPLTGRKAAISGAAADALAREADGATEDNFLTATPPHLTGKEVWFHELASSRIVSNRRKGMAYLLVEEGDL